MPIGCSDGMRVGEGASADDRLPSWLLPLAPQQKSAGAPAASVGRGAVVRAAGGQRADLRQPGHRRGRGPDRVPADRQLAEMVVAPAEPRTVGGDAHANAAPAATAVASLTGTPPPVCSWSVAPQQVMGLPLVASPPPLMQCELPARHHRRRVEQVPAGDRLRRRPRRAGRPLQTCPCPFSPQQ
jgi:hypothetical protein